MVMSIGRSCTKGQSGLQSLSPGSSTGYFSTLQYSNCCQEVVAVDVVHYETAVAVNTVYYVSAVAVGTALFPNGLPGLPASSEMPFQMWK